MVYLSGLIGGLAAALVAGAGYDLVQPAADLGKAGIQLIGAGVAFFCFVVVNALAHHR